MKTLQTLLKLWHSELNAQLNLDDDVRDELESHLLDELESLSHLPLTLEEQFLLANHRLGYPEILDDEFGKLLVSERLNSISGQDTNNTFPAHCSFHKRFMALLLDIGVLTVLWMTLVMSLGSRSTLWLGISILLIHLIIAIYQIIPNYLFGGSLGKLIVGIRISRFDGKPINLLQAILRSAPILFLSLLAIPQEISTLHTLALESSFPTLIRVSSDALAMNSSIIFPSMPLFLLFLWHCYSFTALHFSPRNKAPHDQIAGTIVIDENDYSQHSLSHLFSLESQDSIKI